MHILLGGQSVPYGILAGAVSDSDQYCAYHLPNLMHHKGLPVYFYANPFRRSDQFGFPDVDAHHISSCGRILIRNADGKVVKVVGADVDVDRGPNTL